MRKTGRRMCVASREGEKRRRGCAYAVNGGTTYVSTCGVLHPFIQSQLRAVSPSSLVLTRMMLNNMSSVQ